MITLNWLLVVTNGIAAAGVLAVVLLLQFTVISGRAHQMHKITHNNKEENDIQLVRQFLHVNAAKKQNKKNKIKYCSQVPNLESESSLKSFEDKSQVTVCAT